MVVMSNAVHSMSRRTVAEPKEKRHLLSRLGSSAPELRDQTLTMR
jgi:hypothetical protein